MKNLIVIFLMLPVLVFSQSKPLQVAGSTPDLYLVHTTGPKESFYSIGRIYNISPKIMAPHNQLVLEKGLTIGQVIKIQLNEINFSQDGQVAADEVLIPLYHKTRPKETLYNISVTHNKIPVATLKKWNNLKTDAVPNGSNLVVGYLKVKKDLSPLVSRAVTVKPEESTRVAETTIPVAMENTNPESANKKPVEEPVLKKEETATKIKEPVIRKDPPVVKKEEPAITITSETPVVPANKKEANSGVFKSLFDAQPVNQDKPQSGLAGTFKSNSGWSDRKYYCLHNTARPGTIIKITNQANQLSVYAKVLDVIPDLNQNEGMVLRLSNAGADALGVTSDSFQCSITF